MIRKETSLQPFLQLLKISKEKILNEQSWENINITVPPQSSLSHQKSVSIFPAVQDKNLGIALIPFIFSFCIPTCQQTLLAFP